MRFLFLFFCLTLAGCQTGSETPSGSPEVTLSGQKPEQVKPRILNAALNKGLKLKSDSAFQMTFERPWGNTVASVALGAIISVGAKSVMERVVFSIAEAPGGTRVVAERFMVTAGSFGHEEANPANNAPGLDNLQQLLESVTSTAGQH